MSIIVPEGSGYKLDNTTFFDKDRAESQEIRPLEIAICNIMPLQKVTERHLFELLCNNDVQVNPTIFDFSQRHKADLHYYKKRPEIQDKKYDGLIVTGANFDKVGFEDVTYIQKLYEMLNWSEDHVFRNMYICRGTMLGLKHFYNLEKQVKDKKIFAVKKYENEKDHRILKGIDDEVYIPISCRASNLIPSDGNDLNILLGDNKSPGLIVSNDNKHTFFTGHPEYDRGTLAKEYFRDLILGQTINIPLHYFPDNDKIEEFTELDQDSKIRVILGLNKKLRDAIFDVGYLISNRELYSKILSDIGSANQTDISTDESKKREKFLKPKKMRSASAQLMFRNWINMILQDVDKDFTKTK